jgi:hypothetical protein
MEYTTKQIILCGFLHCHEQKKEYFAQMFFNYISENISALDCHSLEYIYAHIQNQDAIWQEIKKNIETEIKERIAKS